MIQIRNTKYNFVFLVMTARMLLQIFMRRYYVSQSDAGLVEIMYSTYIDTDKNIVWGFHDTFV